MSPGSSIAIASSAVTTAAVRCTAFDRARIDQIADGALDGVERAEPHGPVAKKRHQVRRNGLSEGEALVELWRIEDGLDAVSVDGIGAVALDRVRHEVRRELDHPGARVLVPLLVEAHREPLHRLEQCREQKTHGPAPTTCTRPVEGRVSRSWNRMRGHSPPRSSRRSATLRDEPDRACEATRPGYRSDYAPTSAPASTSSK